MKLHIDIPIILLLLSGTRGLGAQAQEPVQSQAQSQIQPSAQESTSQPAEPTLKPNPLTTLRDFQPDGDEEYRLGRGDEITVDFAGRPDLAAKLIVGPDGRITLPLAGDVVMDGFTRAEAAKAIDSALSAYLSLIHI